MKRLRVMSLISAEQKFYGSFLKIPIQEGGSLSILFLVSHFFPCKLRLTDNLQAPGGQTGEGQVLRSKIIIIVFCFKIHNGNRE